MLQRYGENYDTMKYINTLFRINSLQEYKQFIYDVLAVGVREDNNYAQNVDADGMSISTQFQTLDRDTLEKYVGVIQWKYDNEDDCDGDRVEIHSPEDIQFVEDGELVPNELAFPIILHWNYEDSFDRCGGIEVRHFLWYSVNDTPVYDRSFPKDQAVWKERYQERRDKMIERERMEYPQNRIVA